jgi:hypothetical protein
MLTFRHTLRKIEEVVPFSHIRYFVCHHADPDIAGALPFIDEMIDRQDAVLITHWRSRMLLKHYDLRLPFWLVDEHDWQLQLADRRLHFVFTPYAHFPGAICTFDTHAGVLFSSDIFGGLTDEFSLFAKDEGYFEAMRPFHEHYMPSREVLGHAMAQIEQHPVRLIAPQHGSIIPEHLVDFMVTKLKMLDCGLYLMAKDSSDIQRLLRLNQTLRDAAIKFKAPLEDQTITVSLGIAARKPNEPLLDFIHRTDMALYQAKRSGRNRICKAS